MHIESFLKIYLSVPLAKLCSCTGTGMTTLDPSSTLETTPF